MCESIGSIGVFIPSKIHKEKSESQFFAGSVVAWFVNFSVQSVVRVVIGS